MDRKASDLHLYLKQCFSFLLWVPIAGQDAPEVVLPVGNGTWAGGGEWRSGHG